MPVKSLPDTIWNQDGHCKGESDYKRCDGHKAVLWDWLLHVELQRLAGEEQGIDAHTTRKYHKRKADQYRHGKTCCNYIT